MERKVYTVYNVQEGTKVEAVSLNHVPYTYNISLRNNNKEVKINPT